MKCAACGSEVPEGGMFCPTCGAIAAEAIRVDDPRLASAKDDIRKAVGSRGSTDRIVKTNWIYLPVILLIISYVSMPFLTVYASDHLLNQGSTSDAEFAAEVFRTTVAIMGAVLALAFASQIFFAWLSFRLIDRQNKHFAREKELRAGVLKLLRSAAWSDARKQAAAPEITSLEQAEASARYAPRDPLRWAFLVSLPMVGALVMLLGFYALEPTLDQLGVAIGLIGLGTLVAFIGAVLMLYLFYFLGKEMREHDARWGSFTFLARRGMSKLGLPEGTPYRAVPMPERSFVLYLVITFFFSPFILYWWYTLMKDPNEHFRAQWEFEDHLMAATGQPPIERWPKEFTSVWPR